MSLIQDVATASDVWGGLLSMPLSFFLSTSLACSRRAPSPSNHSTYSLGLESSSYRTLKGMQTNSARIQSVVQRVAVLSQSSNMDTLL